MKTNHRSQYQLGAMAAQAFLRHTQAFLYCSRQFQPRMLRWEIEQITAVHPPEYRAGFLGAIGAYVLTTLEERCLASPHNWPVPGDLEQ
jgi:hypothetical protein